MASNPDQTRRSGICQSALRDRDKCCQKSPWSPCVSLGTAALDCDVGCGVHGAIAVLTWLATRTRCGAECGVLRLLERYEWIMERRRRSELREDCAACCDADGRSCLVVETERIG